MLKLIKYLKSNYFGYRALFPAKFWNYRSLALTGRFQFSTNAIEALNRALKHFLGMGFINMAKLDSEMNRFHSNKVVESTDGLENGRLNSKRRQTILREKNIYDILVTYERYSSLEKIANLQFHLLKIGALTKDSLSPEYFNCLPALTEIEELPNQKSLRLSLTLI